MPDNPTPLTAYQQTYHWRNKNCAPWSYDWFKTALKGIKVAEESGNQSAEVVEVTSITGDCDLGQRKGKLLTIYDFEVELSWTGKSSDGNGEELKGTVKIPEVSHEAIDGLSDYVYEVRLTSSETETPEARSLLAFVRKSLPPLLEQKFNAFRPALLAAHAPSASGAEPSPAASSGTATPNAAASSSSYSPAPPAKDVHNDGGAAQAQNKEAAAAAKKAISTATVEVKATLQASAEDIWGLLTEESKIPMWSRSQSKMTLKPDASFELFGGNVVGKIISVDKPKKLVQTWQTRTNWPADHFGTLTTTLNQGSDSTELILTLDGVPSGQEAEVERAIDTFYIRGLKSMGLGTML